MNVGIRFTKRIVYSGRVCLCKSLCSNTIIPGEQDYILLFLLFYTVFIVDLMFFGVLQLFLGKAYLVTTAGPSTINFSLVIYIYCFPLQTDVNV